MANDGDELKLAKIRASKTATKSSLLLPKPPAELRSPSSSSIQARQRKYSIPLSNSTSSSNLSPDNDDALNTSQATASPVDADAAASAHNRSCREEKKKVSFDVPPDEGLRPLSSSMSRYSPLPRIGSGGVGGVSEHRQQAMIRPTSKQQTPRLAAAEKTLDPQVASKSSVLIGLRLPSGKKLEKSWPSTTLLDTVLDFAIAEMRKENKFANKVNYSLLRMPNDLLRNVRESLAFYKLEDRTMLFVIAKKSLVSK